MAREPDHIGKRLPLESDMAGISPEECARAQKSCSEKQALVVENRIAAGLAPLVRIEAQLEGVIGRLDGLTTLYSRVQALEAWKANLNGHAKAVAEMSAGVVGSGDITNIRSHVESAVKEATSQLVVELKTRRADVFNVPRKYWAPIAVIGVFMLLMASLAGERLLPWLPPLSPHEKLVETPAEHAAHSSHEGAPNGR